MKKIKRKPLFLLVNDIHLHKDNCNLVLNIFREMASICRGNGIENIIIGGDMFTNRSGQPLSVLLTCKECFDIILQCGLNLYIIPGNHDKTDTRVDDSYLDIFQNYESVNVIRHESIKKFGAVGVFFIPYYDEDVWLEKLDDLFIHSNEIHLDKKMLVTHIAVNGVRNNDGSKVASRITIEDLEPFDEVFIGHYHNSSDISDTIHYTGSAYQKDYGEDMDKGFTIIYDDLSFSKIKSTAPRYIKEVVEATDKQGIQNLVEKYENSDDNIRLVIIGKKVDCDRINVNEIRLKYGIDVKVQTDEEVEAMNVSQNETMQFDAVSIKKDFVKFCAENKIVGEKLKFGLNLIKGI